MHWLGWLIMAVMALGLGLACLALSQRNVRSIKPTTRASEWLIETELIPGPLARYFGAKTVRVNYVGADGEWYEVPGRKRTDPEMEMWLFDKWNRARLRGQIHVS